MEWPDQFFIHYRENFSDEYVPFTGFDVFE